MARPRGWTDDQLRQAVAASRSWNEVSEKIGRGRNGSGRKSACGHALRLGLDLSHLPPMAGVKAIASSEPEDPSESELVALAATSTSWGEVMRRLGSSTSTRQYRRVRSLAELIGLDTLHFTGTSGSAFESTATPFANTPEPDAHLRRAGIAVAIQWFLNRGYMVSLPVDHAAYDLVAESDDGLQRIQVKTTTQKRHSAYVVAITRHEYGSERRSNGYYWRNRPYRHDEVDLFFICAGNGACYLVPVEVTRGQKSLTLDARLVSYQV